jgi:hypothetical protein
MSSLMGVISNPLDLHLLRLPFCLPGVEELWTATLRFLPATWPTKTKGLQINPWNGKGRSHTALSSISVSEKIENGPF